MDSSKKLKFGQEVDYLIADTPYADEAAMWADQANQKKGYIYIAGKKHYEKLSSSTGSINDYRVIGGGDLTVSNYQSIHSERAFSFEAGYIEGIAADFSDLKAKMDAWGYLPHALLIDTSNVDAVAFSESRFADVPIGTGVWFRRYADFTSIYAIAEIANPGKMYSFTTASGFTYHVYNAAVGRSVDIWSNQTRNLGFGFNPLPGSKPMPLTGASLDLSNISGNIYNYGAASSATTYTTTTPVINGYAKCLINAASEPTVTGATKIKGATFTANTDMEMIVESVDGVNVRYFFLEL